MWDMMVSSTAMPEHGVSSGTTTTIMTCTRVESHGSRGTYQISAGLPASVGYLCRMAAISGGISDKCHTGGHLSFAMERRTVVFGRPYIYLAVDTATHLIAGVYVGFSCDETAVMACIAQAAMDKVAYCARYEIEITQD